MISPLAKAPQPEARCCTLLLRLMKLPRRRGSTQELIMVMATIMRPELAAMRRNPDRRSTRSLRPGES